MSSPSIFSAIQKIRDLLTREEKFRWLGIAGFALCSSLLEVLTATLIVVFAQVLNQPETGQRYLAKLGFMEILPPGRLVFYMALLVGAVYLFKNIVSACEAFYQNFSIQKMNYHFKNKLLHRYAEAEYGFYLTRNSSLGMAVVGGDAESMFSGGMLALGSILSEGVIFVLLIAMVVAMNPSLAFSIFGIGLVLGVIVSKGLLPRFYVFGQRLQEASLHTSQNLLQFFHAFKEIILLGKREAFVDAYKYYSLKKSRVQALQTATNLLPRMVIEVVFMGLFVATIAFLCLEHESPIQMMGILGGYLYTGFRLMPGLNRMISQINTFKSTIPSIERVHKEYLSVATKESYEEAPGLTFQKSITFEDVDFRYLHTKKNALNHISFSIQKGECIGIVGETGSGKSTLVDLVLGLLHPSSGSIVVDDKFPVNSYQWHQKIGYVPQSIYLTDDTIEANIAFGEKEIDDVRLNAAMDAAQLRKFITHLPEGSKTVVGERGIRLSGGERQRIAIARALYRNPEVLIFDEATSALDNETEAALMETIHKVSQARTVIMIAHRLTTLKDCDRIVVMEGGHLKSLIDYETLNAQRI